MPLLNRQKHKLIDIIARAYPLDADAAFILNNAQIGYQNIDMAGSSNRRWNNIIEHLKDTDHFGTLLDLLENDFPNREANEEKRRKFEEIISEIKWHSSEHVIELMREVIPKGECVLFLGPDAFKCIHNNTIKVFNEFLCGQLINEKLEPLNIFYEEGQSDNLGYLIDRYDSREFASVADTKAFAKQQYDLVIQQPYMNLYNTLSNLGFRLVVNTNPDMLFGVGNDFLRLRYDQSNNKKEELTEELLQRRIIYNIYGSFENPQSVLFTEKEAVGFTKCAYEKSPPILQEVKTIVKQSYGLFIGFDFREWPLKILFDVLDLKNKPGNFAISEEEIPDQYLEYYARQYNMTFVKVDANFFNEL